MHKRTTLTDLTWRRMGLLAALLLATPACAGPDRGTTGGRIDPYRTTASDEGSNQMSIPAMLEFTDRTAESLAQDITGIPEIAKAPERRILALGDLLNKSRTSTVDMELMQRRLREKLANSSLVRSKLRFVEDYSRIKAERARVTGGNVADGPNVYAPANTFILQGDLLEARRGDRRQYYMEFKLTNLQSSEIVYSRGFDLGQVRRKP